MNALVQVLAGRDEAPAWHSAASRRMAAAAGWLGWALLAASATTATLLGSRHGLVGGAATPVRAGGHGTVSALAWLAVSLAVCAAVPLAPRFALLAWRLAYLGVLVTPLIPGHTRADGGFYLVLTIAFTVAAVRYGPPRLWWMAVLSLVPVWLWTPPVLRGAEGGSFPLGLARHPDWAYPLRLTIGLAVLTALLYGAGRWRRDRAALAAQEHETRVQAALAHQQAGLARQHAQLAREHEELARFQARLAQHQSEEARRQGERRAALEERARIAREMHDVVAHHMSMIAVQAETAPYRITGLPDGAQAEFAALGQSARDALTDMRRLLGVLRDPAPRGGSPPPGTGSGPPERLPQPGLADVPALVEGARRAGADITVQMPCREAAASPVVGLTAYRIVQESLSNAARHAPGAAIQVAIQQEAGIVKLKIENEASAAGEPGGGRDGDASGHGLAGMRERVAMVGGWLQAGPRPDGGFAVHADLPAGGAPRGGGAAGEQVR